MQQVIGQILPLAVGIDISALSIAAVILMLGTPKARSNGLTFLVGWIVGLFVVGGIALVLASAADLSSSTDSASRSPGVINLLLGILLLVLAARGWRSRPKAGEQPPLPKWMASLDTITPPRSAGLAALLSGINPKNLALNLAAMSIIASAGLSPSSQLVALLVFVLVGSIAIIVPVVVYFAGGDRAAAVLAGWKEFLVDNNPVIMAVLLLVFGMVLIGKGISQL
jgi:threonine/homoserine/homoserine lactone efflux protein